MELHSFKKKNTNEVSINLGADVVTENGFLDVIFFPEIKDDDRKIQRVEIVSQAAGTVTTRQKLEKAFAVGTRVYVKQKFIPDTKIFIEGNIPVGATFGSTVGNFVSVNAEYGRGTLEDPKPGFFVESQIHENEDPKRVEVIGGVYGLPVLFCQEGIMVATVSS